MQQIEAIIVICECERFDEFFPIRRDRDGEVVEFGNTNAYIYHEVTLPFQRV
ncbi:MAG: hypothetical protein IKO03_10685 [Lachnospiraceae bacterium]|nr:hypothetical protein [Lachnospiraceae bacterium]